MELVSLGLTSQEAHIYLFFAQNNFDRKKEVMRKLEMGEKELTDTIQRLTKKGFLETKLEDSNIFSVIPLKTIMKRLIQEKLKEVQEIKSEIRDYDLH
jgi:sugar-specific transcriptional regulator TrmB